MNQRARSLQNPGFTNRVGHLLRSPWVIASAAFSSSLALELWLALPNWFQTHFYGVPATTSIAKLLPILGGSDSGSYLTGALDLQDGSVSPTHQWIFNLWPPGMPAILASMIKLGNGASPILPMVFLLCVLWSFNVATMAVFLIPRRGYIGLGLFAIFWILSPIFTGWTIHAGVLGSDGVATALGSLVTIGLLWASLRPPAGRPRLFLYIGLAAALAGLAYLRIMWFYAVPTSLVIVLIIVLVRIVVKAAQGDRKFISRNRSGFIEWVALGAVFLILCAPWTIYVGKVLHPGNFQWSTGDYQWAQLWMSDKYLASVGGGFLEEGGGNWPCDIDPQKCRELSRIEFSTTTPYGGQAPNTFTVFQHDAFKVALTHPLQFVAGRSEVTLRTWLSVPGAGVGTFGNIGFGLVTLLTFIGALLLLAIESIKRRAAGPLTIFLILGTNIGVIWLTHFETRYVVPLQAISLIVVIFWATKYEENLWGRIAARRGTVAITALEKFDA